MLFVVVSVFARTLSYIARIAEKLVPDSICVRDVFIPRLRLLTSLSRKVQGACIHGYKEVALFVLSSISQNVRAIGTCAKLSAHFVRGQLL